jgi:hypothetical protein
MAATGQTGVAHLPLPVIRFIGLSEILGALGLLLPGPLHFAPVLTPVAALCLGLIVILAARIHYGLREPAAVAVNLVLLALALLVACGRLAHPV